MDLSRKQFLASVAASVPAVALIGRAVTEKILEDHIVMTFTRKDSDCAITDSAFRVEHLEPACRALLCTIGKEDRVKALSSTIMLIHDNKDYYFWFNRMIMIRWKQRYDAVLQAQLYMIDALIYAKGIVLEEYLWKPSQPVISTLS